MSSNEQGGRDWKDISSKRNSTRKALEVRSSESEPEGIWYSWNMREGGIGRVKLKKWTEMRPLSRNLDSILQSVGTTESFYTSDISDLWFGNITMVAGMKARFGR